MRNYKFFMYIESKPGTFELVEVRDYQCDTRRYVKRLAQSLVNRWCDYVEVRDEFNQHVWCVEFQG